MLENLKVEGIVSIEFSKEWPGIVKKSPETEFIMSEFPLYIINLILIPENTYLGRQYLENGYPRVMIGECCYKISSILI